MPAPPVRRGEMARANDVPRDPPTPPPPSPPPPPPLLPSPRLSEEQPPGKRRRQRSEGRKHTADLPRLKSGISASRSACVVLRCVVCCWVVVVVACSSCCLSFLTWRCVQPGRRPVRDEVPHVLARPVRKAVHALPIAMGSLRAMNVATAAAAAATLVAATALVAAALHAAHTPAAVTARGGAGGLGRVPRWFLHPCPSRCRVAAQTKRGVSA